MAKEYVEVKGIRELAVVARKLNDEVKAKIAYRALLAGARITRNAARGLAPVLQAKYQGDPRRQAGTLRNAIVAARVRKGDFPEEVVAIVGVRMLSKASIAKFKQQTGKSGAANPRDPYYWWAVEAGTRGHVRRKQAIPGTRFLKRGFEGNVERSLAALKKTFTRDVLKYGNRLAGPTR